MRILIVDDSPDELRSLSETVSSVRPDAEIQCVESSLEALAVARTKEIDVAFL